MTSRSPGLNSGGGSKNGMSLVWFLGKNDRVIEYLRCRSVAYLDPQQPIPSSIIISTNKMIRFAYDVPFYEMSSQIASWLADNLHANIVPVHS